MSGVKTHSNFYRRPNVDSDSRYDQPLFPRKHDLHGVRVPMCKVNKPKGAFKSENDLLKTHIGLLTEDFLCTLSQQVAELRRRKRKLPASAFHVQGLAVEEKKTKRSSYQTGIVLQFDASAYQHIDWETDKRFMTGNIVLLTKKDLKTFSFGVVTRSRLRDLRKGRVVVEMCSGVSERGFFNKLDHKAFQGRSFVLVESSAFYFPYLHVTNALRNDMNSLLPHHFLDELVLAKFPSRAPTYKFSVVSTKKARKTLSDLNASQMAAMKSVLAHRVALVQGPPGTGKTFLGTKIAQYFVELRSANQEELRSPIVVVTTTNHAVDEFLTRCSTFTNKLIHCYSSQHEKVGYGALQTKYEMCKNRSDKLACMLQADIIAMTTTRAAVTRPTLDNLGVKILIVEEAAEAMEGHVLAAITRDVRHLILLGDHRQLQPNPSCQMMATKYGLDVSLFERLIANGADCAVLDEQRRMRPEISKLVRSIYPHLQDHPSTRNRPDVKGISKNVFFLKHSHAETKKGTGFFNEFEAQMAVELANYFLLQDYSPSDITILTTYRWQLSAIQDSLREHGGEVMEVRVSTVDNFQGEENNLIILSLVRSNASNGIGFMKRENRACVALSRARDCLIVLGNLDCITASRVQVWKHVRESLSAAGEVGSALPLVCSHGKAFSARSVADVWVAGKGCVVCQVMRAFKEAVQSVEQLELDLSNLEEDQELGDESDLSDFEPSSGESDTFQDLSEETKKLRATIRKREKRKRERQAVAAARRKERSLQLEAELEAARSKEESLSVLSLLVELNWGAGFINAKTDTFASVRRKLSLSDEDIALIELFARSPPRNGHDSQNGVTSLVYRLKKL